MPPMPPIFGQRGHDDGQHGSGPSFDGPFSHFAWGGGPNRTPGAWPADDNTSPPYEHTEGVADAADAAATYTGYQAKYKAAGDVEAKIMDKEAELLKLHERIVEERLAANANAGQYGGSSSSSSSKGDDGSEKEKHGPSKMEAEVLAVQKEIDGLARTMEKLRTEADEEFARELAEEEQRQARV
jgi:hypothetical protein